ncbi:hypothetical protein [Limosilactobacillus fermentum]|uniref:hypothetical protein n=1 Tax=Limosilactobacillus fermentum TaxID=1613 RepID=UPI0023A91D20|nr:hypothetical protein [Limosilactobacillus fermentum]WEB66520.1 hypothetical protein PUW73_08135 [Limosilactobacillus fermentum]
MSNTLLNNNSNFKIVVSYAEKLFFTNKGYFNWIAITGIIAIGTFIWTIWFNNKKYRADLISKTRIDWMNQVRPLYAQYIAAVPHYMFLYNKAMVGHDHDERANEVLTEQMDEIRRLYYELNLYIPDNDSNKIILNYINLLWYELGYVNDYYDYGIINNLFGRSTSYELDVDKYISGLIIRSSTEGSKYFKNEWEKIKKGQ